MVISSKERLGTSRAGTSGHIPEEEQEVGAIQELLDEVLMGVGHLDVLPGVEG